MIKAPSTKNKRFPFFTLIVPVQQTVRVYVRTVVTVLYGMYMYNVPVFICFYNSTHFVRTVPGTVNTCLHCMYVPVRTVSYVRPTVTTNNYYNLNLAFYTVYANLAVY